MWRSKLERGVSAVEYAVIIALISVGVLGGVTVVGEQLGNVTEEAATTIGDTAHNPNDPGDVIGGGDENGGDPGSGDPGNGDPGSGNPGGGLLDGPWDDLSGYDCGYDALAIISPYQNKSNYAPAFLEHGMTDSNAFVAGDAVVTLSQPDVVKHWLACGGSPQLHLTHYWGVMARTSVALDGAHFEDWGNVYNYNQLCYTLSEPRVRGNQLIFTKVENVPDGSPCRPDSRNGAVYKSDLDFITEHQDRLHRDYPGLPSGVSSTVKTHDSWTAYISNDAQPARFTMPDGYVVAPDGGIGAWDKGADYNWD